MNPTWSRAPSGWPILLAGKAAIPKAGNTGSGHGFRTPTHSAHTPRHSPDVDSLEPQLDCGAQQITVSLDRCQLEGLGFRDEVRAYLQNRSCSSIIQGQERNLVSVTSPAQANACGNILEVRGVPTRSEGETWAGGGRTRSCETLGRSLSLSGPLGVCEIHTLAQGKSSTQV